MSARGLVIIMPNGQKVAIDLGADVKFDVIEGHGFVTVREAAKLGGVHPVVLEMGQRLLKSIGGAGAAFALATPALQNKAEDVEAMFKKGLRRVAKALEPGKKIKVKTHRDANRIVFWYAA